MRGFYLIVLFLVSFQGIDANAQGWLWAKGNTKFEDGLVEGWPTATDPLGNVFVAGFAKSDKDAVFGNYSIPKLDPKGKFQCVLVKYDPAGNVLWAKGTQNARAYTIGIATDKIGNVYLLGMFGGPDSTTPAQLKIGSITLTCSHVNDKNYFLAKFNSNGDVVWAVNAGNTQTDWVRTPDKVGHILGIGGIATDNENNVFITTNFHVSTTLVGGYTLTNADPSGNTDDILLVKYNSFGDVVWAKSAGGTANDDAYGLTVTPEGDVYIAGTTKSPFIVFGSSTLTNTTSKQIAFIARYDATGNPIWGSNSGNDPSAGGTYAVGLASDENSNVYMTGGVPDSSIEISGTKILNPHAPTTALFLIKLDRSNKVNWSKIIGWPAKILTQDSITTFKGGWAVGYSIAVCPCGQIWVGGAMSDSIVIDNDTLIADRYSSDPVFIAGFTFSGVHIGASSLMSGGDDQNGIACDNKGNVFLCSDFSSVIVAGADTIVSLLNENLFVTKHGHLDLDPYNFDHSNIIVCLDGGISLNPSTSFSNYIWSDGFVGTSHSIKDTGIYWAYGLETCGASSIDTFNVVTDCDCSKFLFIPNSFTPNNDGQNDVFYPRAGHGAVKTIKTFQVYNRWGELLHERSNFAPNDKSKAWDGTYKGQVALPEVYVYVVEVLCESGSVIFKKGSVTVIR